MQLSESLVYQGNLVVAVVLAADVKVSVLNPSPAGEICLKWYLLLRSCNTMSKLYVVSQEEIVVSCNIKSLLMPFREQLSLQFFFPLFFLLVLRYYRLHHFHSLMFFTGLSVLLFNKMNHPGWADIKKKMKMVPKSLQKRCLYFQNQRLTETIKQLGFLNTDILQTTKHLTSEQTSPKAFVIGLLKNTQINPPLKKLHSVFNIYPANTSKNSATNISTF